MLRWMGGAVLKDTTRNDKLRLITKVAPIDENTREGHLR